MYNYKKKLLLHPYGNDSVRNTSCVYLKSKHLLQLQFFAVGYYELEMEDPPGHYLYIS